MGLPPQHFSISSNAVHMSGKREAAGKAFESSYSVKALNRVFSSTRYTYDAQGRVTENTQQLPSAHAHVETVRYNEHGDKAEEYTIHSVARRVDEHYEARHEYRCDNRDNWTEQVRKRLDPAPDAEFAVAATYRRHLVYY